VKEIRVQSVLRTKSPRTAGSEGEEHAAKALNVRADCQAPILVAVYNRFPPPASRGYCFIDTWAIASGECVKEQHTRLFVLC